MLWRLEVLEMWWLVSVKHFRRKGTSWKLFFLNMIVCSMISSITYGYTNHYSIALWSIITILGCTLIYYCLFMQALDVEVESYFDGQLYKNKIWVGAVEGESSLWLHLYIYLWFLTVTNLTILEICSSAVKIKWIVNEHKFGHLCYSFPRLCNIFLLYKPTLEHFGIRVNTSNTRSWV